MIKLKRIYETPDNEDGVRVLVERLWPRGVSKETAHLNDWLRDIAPSDDLRKWYSHQPERWEMFREEYLKELEMHAGFESISKLVKWANDGDLTLLYAAKDTERNSAVVLRGYLNQINSKS